MLQGGEAHGDVETLARRIPANLRGKRPRGAAHSAWELLEHIRLAQRDILDYVLDPGYESPPWPEGYWPESPAPPSARAWSTSLNAIKEDRDQLIKLVADKKRDLFAPIGPNGEHDLFREVLISADHAGYHLGQLALLAQMLKPR